jgi:acyl-CoA reductase-like NAD-dependent aldehyde dehydrogenase
MQEVLMAVLVPRKSSQLPLFARAQRNPHWTNLSSDVQPKIVRLLAQLLRQHRETLAKIGIAEEARGE